jgi:hypothetical protein
MPIQQHPALTLTEMGCSRPTIPMTTTKLLKCRLAKQMTISLTHRKKTSTMTTIMMMMKKNERYGRMVRRCTCKYQQNFYTLLIVGIRSACACIVDLTKEVMQKSLQLLPRSLHLRRPVQHSHLKPTSNIQRQWPWQTGRATAMHAGG